MIKYILVIALVVSVSFFSGCAKKEPRAVREAKSREKAMAAAQQMQEIERITSEAAMRREEMPGTQNMARPEQIGLPRPEGSTAAIPAEGSTEEMPPLKNDKEVPAKK